MPCAEHWKEGLSLYCKTNESPVVLVDMDNTLVNWELQFERLMKNHYPHIPIVPPWKRTHFKIEQNYNVEYRDEILHLTSLDEFWLTMDPIQGALEALNDMRQIGLVVFIVTTPDAHHTSRSAYEKITWIERHLGWDWKMRSILTHDKTLVNGDILIDDKPAASVGLLRPSWTHMLFSQPYNVQHGFCPRLDSWKNWGPAVYNVLIEREKQKHIALTNMSHEKLRFTVPYSSKGPSNSNDDVKNGNNKLQSKSNECCGFSRFGSPYSTSHCTPLDPTTSNPTKAI